MDARVADALRAVEAELRTLAAPDQPATPTH
jgi:hypothetical protein